MEFQLGPISSGTLRNQDLIPAMLNTLHTLVDDDTEHQVFDAMTQNTQYHDGIGTNSLRLIRYTRNKNDEVTYPVVCADEAHEYWQSDDAQDDYDTLAEALNDCCPAYVVFGADEGDGADFGFWPDIDRINEDIANAEYHNGDDILLLEEMVLVTVNDHGNVTVRDIWSHDILWSCV